MIDEARNAVLGRLISAAPPSSPTMVGSTVASISTFIECSRMPPSSTASGASHSRRTSMLQPCRSSAPAFMGADYASPLPRYHRRRSGAFMRLRLDQRALAFVQRPEGLAARHRGDHLHEVP